MSPHDKGDVLIEAANASLVANDPTGALQYLKQAEEIDPSRPEIYHLRAIAFHTKKNLPMALESMKKAIDLQPNDTNANNTYGKLLLDSGQYVQAEPHLIKAASDPTYRDAYKPMTNLGILYYRENKLNQSSEWLQKAVADQPNEACIAYYYLGHIALKLGKVGEAASQYERATQKDCAAFVEAHLALGIVYTREKEWDKARRKFIEIKQNFPESKASDEAMERLKAIPSHS